MNSTLPLKNVKSHLHIETLSFEDISYYQKGMDPILTHVDFQFPMDTTIVFESSKPMASLILLKIIAGSLAPTSGKVLWNNADVFSADDENDPREISGSYFEQNVYHFNLKVSEYLKCFFNEAENDNIVEQFDLNHLLNEQMTNLKFSDRKLLRLLSSLSQSPEVIFFEDPAHGLTESQWLNFLDYLQYYQRRGYCRHVFLTNHHPSALNHLEHVKLYIEDGLLYLDEVLPIKKVAHF